MSLQLSIGIDRSIRLRFCENQVFFSVPRFHDNTFRVTQYNNDKMITIGDLKTTPDKLNHNKKTRT